MALVIVVGGGRDYTDRDHVFRVLDAIHLERGIRRLGHGACGWDANDSATHYRSKLRGADRFADEWAHERKVIFARYPAAWSFKRGGFGGSAGGRPPVVVGTACVS